MRLPVGGGRGPGQEPGRLRAGTWVTAGVYLSLLAWVGLYIWLFALGDTLAHVDVFLIIQTLMLAAYAVLAFLILRDPGPDDPLVGRRFMVAAMVAAGIAAVLLLLLKTSLSSDVYRYLWDGWLLKSGINPYLVLPVDPQLASFRALDPSLYARMFWTGEYTPYPPMAQLIFAAAHTAYAAIGLPAAKLVLALPVVILAVALYRQAGRRWFVLFVLNPPLLTETFNGGHIDAWAALFAFFAYQQFAADGLSRSLGAWDAGRPLDARKGLDYAGAHRSPRSLAPCGRPGGVQRPTRVRTHLVFSAVLLALGALTKLFPAIFLPLFLADLLKRRRFRDALLYGAVFAGIVGAGYLPFTLASPFPLLRLFAFARTFRFNSPIFTFLSEALRPIGGSDEIVLQVCGIAFMLALAYLALRHRVSAYVVSAAFVLYLLSLPLIYSWYIMLLVPMLFLAFSQDGHRRRVFGLIAAQWLLGLTYFVGSPLAYNVPEGQKHLGGLVFMAVELLLTVGIFAWFRGPRVFPGPQPAEPLPEPEPEGGGTHHRGIGDMKS